MSAYLYAALARARARAALKRNFSAALLISFIADLPSLLTQVFRTLAVTPVITEVSTGLNQHGRVFLEQMRRWTVDDVLMRMDHTWGTLALALLAVTLLTSFLRLGAVNSQLKLLRGEEIGPADVLSRASAFFRAIGLVLWRTLWMILWALPGLAVSALILLLTGLLAGADPQGYGVLFGAETAMLLGMSVCIFLMGWAEIRYFCAECVMADHPETGPVRAFRESRRLVKGNVRRILMMLLSFVGLYLVTNLIGGLLPGVAGLVLSLALSAVLSLYLSACTCAMYEQMCGPDPEVIRIMSDGNGNGL